MKRIVLELTVVAAIIFAGTYYLVEDTKAELKDHKKMTKEVIQKINHSENVTNY